MMSLYSFLSAIELGLIYSLMVLGLFLSYRVLNLSLIHIWMVEPLTLAAIAAGADGVMIEVHNNPEKALCDGAQSLRPEQFDALMKKVNKTKEFFKTL